MACVSLFTLLSREHMKLNSLPGQIQAILMPIYDRLRRWRDWLPYKPVPDLEPEASYGLIRFVQVLTGLVSLHRTICVLVPGLWYWESHEMTSLTLGWLLHGALSIFVALGMFGGIPCLLLAALHIPLSRETYVMNLGPMVLHGLLIALAFAGPPKPGMRWYLPDLNAAHKLHLVRWFMFACIAVNHLAAVMYHLNDNYWMEGKTVTALLTNPYMCKLGPMMQGFLLSWGETGERLMHVFSIASCYIQEAWQFLMLPLLASRWRWGVWFVKWQGWAFTLFSFALNISCLPAFEVAAWAFIFGAPFAKGWSLWGGGQEVRQIPASRAVIYTGYAFHAWLVLALVYALAHASEKMRIEFSKTAVFEKTQLIGLWAPDVFNRGDLRTADNWLIFSYQNEAGDSWDIPLNNLDGTRGWWCWSDVLYYGNSLRQRRGPTYVPHPYDYLGSMAPQYGGVFMAKLFQFHHRLEPRAANAVCTVTHYTSAASDLDVPLAQRYEVKSKPCMKLTFRDGKAVEVLIEHEKMQPFKDAVLGKDMKKLF
jgi:hypothetical protein